ncbi:histidine phosphatase family protein [Schumannella sp. 10F1B-5-1]|uniref:histidine phosphatase family protein n=1 Tax=Schumannella sp. 10F1B-5-1 TaxID=2590780 RepID=UPI001130A58C|nr:histidine phosphatase family protein [Schumannella sp. 10F1B-5-1]TPW70946.1 histidine phosphatase family protein [Schumannella sp. 10F1B-5-1]
MTELYLVRHGETDWNLARRIQGTTDIPLNDTGRAQAQATGRLLARRQWDGIYASPLGRAMETGSIIAAELGMPTPTPVLGVVEREYGEAEGLTWEQIEERFPEGAEVPGRETREHVAERVVAALCELANAHPGEKLIVVSHGGAIRSVLQTAEPDAKHPMITNGSVHSFRMTEGGLELIAFDDSIEAESLGGGGDIEQQNALEHRPA